MRYLMIDFLDGHFITSSINMTSFWYTRYHAPLLQSCGEMSGYAVFPPCFKVRLYLLSDLFYICTIQRSLVSRPLRKKKNGEGVWQHGHTMPCPMWTVECRPIRLQSSVTSHFSAGFFLYNRLLHVTNTTGCINCQKLNQYATKTNTKLQTSDRLILMYILLKMDIDSVKAPSDL